MDLPTAKHNDCNRLSSVLILFDSVQSDIVTQEQFGDLIGAAVAAGIAVADIAKKFQLDRSGVERWIARTHAPRESVRTSVLQGVREIICAELQLAFNCSQKERRYIKTPYHA